MLWSSSISAQYLIQLYSANTSLLTLTIPDLPLRGITPSQPTNFTINFLPTEYSQTQVSLFFTFLDTNSSEFDSYSISFVKLSYPPTCDGLCLRGECIADSCQCDPGWTHTWNCDLGFWTDKNEVCIGEEFTFYWENFYANQLLDWFSIVYPFEGERTPTKIVAAAESEGFIAWGYFGSSDRVTQTFDNKEYYPQGSYSFTIWDNRRVGDYTLVYFSNDRYDIIAFHSLTVLPLEHPRCRVLFNESTAEANSTACVHGEYNATEGVCECSEESYFGLRCENGCSSALTLDTFGADFASSDGPNLTYINDLTCTWLIQPATDFVVSGLSFTFSTLALEVFDFVRIYDGTEANETFELKVLTGISGGELTFEINSTTVFVEFTSGADTPGWPALGTYGFMASYRAIGCPSGYYVRRSGVIRDCVPCEPRTFSIASDTLDACPPCSAYKLDTVKQLGDTQLVADFVAQCQPAIGRWRRAAAIIAIFVWSVSVIVGLVVLTLKRRVPPLEQRSVALIIFHVLGSGVLLMVPFSDLYFHLFPCNLLFWLATIRLHLLLTPLLIALYRLRVLLDYQTLKKQVQLSLQNQYNQKVALAFRRAAAELQLWLAEPRIAAIALASQAPGVLAGLLSWNNADNLHSSLGGCVEPVSLRLVELVFALIYMALYLFGLYRVKNGLEGYGLKRELASFFLVYILVVLIYFGSVLSVSDDTILEAWDLRYFLWMLGLILIVNSLLLPAARTFPGLWSFTQRVDQTKEKARETLTLEDLLATKRGLAFFLEHCRSEFSEENVLCYKEIESFRKRTTLDRLDLIFHKYLKSEAPLEVNISGTLKQSIEKKFGNLSENPDIAELQDFLDPVRQELIDLMKGDTFHRFLNSALFDMYVRNEAAPTENKSMGIEFSESAPPSRSPSQEGFVRAMSFRQEEAYIMDDGPGRGRGPTSSPYSPYRGPGSIAARQSNTCDSSVVKDGDEKEVSKLNDFEAGKVSEPVSKVGDAISVELMNVESAKP